METIDYVRESGFKLSAASEACIKKLNMKAMIGYFGNKMDAETNLRSAAFCLEKVDEMEKGREGCTPIGSYAIHNWEFFNIPVVVSILADKLYRDGHWTAKSSGALSRVVSYTPIKSYAIHGWDFASQETK